MRRWNWNPLQWAWWTYTYPWGVTHKVRGPLTIMEWNEPNDF